MKEARFAIGTKYKNRSKAICEVVDILKTYNNAGELVQIRYVSAHLFLGQMLKDYDVLDTTIARNLIV